MEKRELFRNLGFEEGEIDGGNIGFELESMEGYFARERAENRLAEGFPVPEEFIPDVRSQHEKDLWRWSKQLERLEAERCEEDKSQSWGWTDKEERQWLQDLKEAGYNVDSEGHICGIAVEEQKNRISSLLAQGVLKLSK